MEALQLVGWVLSSYLVGSIPFGLMLGKLLFGVDIREHGSRNLGATNAARVLGKGRKIVTVAFFLAVFLLDAGKGFAPALLANRFAGDFYGVHAGLFAGGAAVAGHMASVYLKFRGGKGVAVSAGALAALCPVPLAIGAGAWVAGTLSTRYVSVGSLCAALTLPVAVALWDYDPVLVTTCVVAALTVIVKHRSNIVRLIRGTENRIAFGGERIRAGEDS